jgi:hypothetical protein
MAQRGDTEAFEYIYKLHCERVYALGRRMARDTSEAEVDAGSLHAAIP